MRDAEFLRDALGEELHRGDMLPTRRAAQRIRLQNSAIREMDLVLRKAVDVSDMDLDRATRDEVEKGSVVVENRKRRRREHGVAPRLELGQLRVRVVLVEGDDIAAEDAPELVDDGAADGAAVVEVARLLVAVGVAPAARAEPGEHARVDELLEPLLEGGDIGGSHPDGAMAGFFRGVLVFRRGVQGVWGDLPRMTQLTEMPLVAYW